MTAERIFILAAALFAVIAVVCVYVAFRDPPGNHRAKRRQPEGGFDPKPDWDDDDFATLHGRPDLHAANGERMAGPETITRHMAAYRDADPLDVTEAWPPPGVLPFTPQLRAETELAAPSGALWEEILPGPDEITEQEASEIRERLMTALRNPRPQIILPDPEPAAETSDDLFRALTVHDPGLEPTAVIGPDYGPPPDARLKALFDRQDRQELLYPPPGWKAPARPEPEWWAGTSGLIAEAYQWLGQVELAVAA